LQIKGEELVCKTIRLENKLTWQELRQHIMNIFPSKSFEPLTLCAWFSASNPLSPNFKLPDNDPMDFNDNVLPTKDQYLYITASALRGLPNSSSRCHLFFSSGLLDVIFMRLLPTKDSHLIR
jgi:hypothetical protein